MDRSDPLPPLRPFQAQSIDLLQKNRSLHLICIAGTGAGKSRIFEELARSSDHHGRFPLTLVIAPLQALVRQHSRRLENLGVRILRHPEDKCRDGPAAAVLTPERLARLLERGMRIPEDCLLVVDECHCIAEWGPSFRPEFRLIPELVTRFAIRRSLWLSATLPPTGRQELLRLLPSPVRELGEFSTPSTLRISRVRIRWPSRPGFLRHWTAHDPSPGIIFCATRGQSLDVARLLKSWSDSPETVACYHAGMSREERLKVEDGIREGRLRRIAATSAFGMGMDFPSLRWTVIWQVPYTVLDLAQMIGRAGRSRDYAARAFLLWDDSDFFWLRNHSDPATIDALRKLFEGRDSVENSLRSYFSTESLNGATGF